MGRRRSKAPKCRRRSRGGAAVSSKHTLALVNKGGASAADLILLAREIRNRVADRFGVTLFAEPVFVGFDSSIASEFVEE